MARHRETITPGIGGVETLIKGFREGPEIRGLGRRIGVEGKRVEEFPYHSRMKLNNPRVLGPSYRGTMGSMIVPSCIES